VRGRWPPAPLLAGIVAALALLALTGYVTRVTSLYGHEGVTQMAIPTTIAFLLMAAGLVLARPDLPAMRALLSDTPGGAMLRRFLPVVVIAPVLLAALHLAGEQAGLFHDETGDWYVMAATIVLSVALVLLPARSIDRADAHRRRAEARQAGNERIRRIVETANDAFLSTDPTGRITSWNASPRRIFGWTAEEALGQDLADLLAPEEVRERYGSGAAERDIDGGVERQNALETVARHRDGHVLPVEISVTGVRESDGWVFNCFLRAITGRRRAHQELHGAQLEVLSRLALAAEYRDDDTGEHTGAWASSRHASRSPWACPSPRSS
jgi:PAS domain S-box-containing protein